MKNSKPYSFIRLLSILMAIASSVASGQVAPIPAANTVTGMDEANYAAWDEPDQPIGPNHRTTLGPVSRAGRSRTVELANGMNYWDGRSWSPSDPSFAPSATGFSALHVQHPVQLADDLYMQRAVTVRTPDGIILSSSPIGIALYDAASGNFSVIASITNCTPSQVSSNQVLYADAFGGQVCASILYTLNAESFQQDVIITGRLDPADYGFPRATTRVQILTEFYGAPVPDQIMRPLYVEQDPDVRRRKVTPDLVDHQLGFGRFVLNQGTTHVAPGGTNTTGSEALVAKEFQSIGGRTFLVESVTYTAISNALQALPPCRTMIGAALKPAVGYAGIPRLLPRRQTMAAARQGQNKSPHGLVIDYVASIGGSMSGTIVFKGDTTYLVSSGVACNGPTTVEGGAVFKYKSGTSITLNSALTCKTASYRPAIFTAVDDNAVGDTMNGVTNSGYTGTINTNGYANPALSLVNAINISNFRFCYAQEAIQASMTLPTIWSVTHAQFINCVKGIEMVSVASGSGSGSGSGRGNFIVNNCLMSGVRYPFLGTDVGLVSPTDTVSLYNSTIDHSALLSTLTGGATLTINATNSIFASISSSFTASGINNGFYSSASTFGSPSFVVSSSPFQAVGAAGYYLTAASGFSSDATTVGLSASLKADLQKRTVYPPLVLSATVINTNLTLVPQASRDTNNSSIGYHYDPLDYAFGSVYFTNAALTVTAGTDIGTFGTNGSIYGLGVGQGASFNSQGTPTRPNWIVLYNMVMEGTNGNWQRPTNSVTGELYGYSPSPTIFGRFTDWSVPAQDAVQFYAPTNSGPISFQDSEFHGGKLISYRPTINLTNCLLERVFASLSSVDGNSPYIRNNLFLGGTLNFAPNVTNSFVKDNLFDQTAIPTNTVIYTNYNGGFNAFVTNNNRLLPTFATDIILTNSPAYQTGPLGYYYQAANSTLINVGHTNADQVGLYHFTVTTNLAVGLQIKETNSVVDIGYHYVAVDANGNPIDTDGDGLADYLEDANGNGLVDGAESSWLLNSFNGLSFGNGLQIFTPLK